jgi:hypothetical protein
LSKCHCNIQRLKHLWFDRAKKAAEQNGVQYRMQDFFGGVTIDILAEDSSADKQRILIKKYTKQHHIIRAHIVLRNIGNYTSCLSREGSWKNWLTLSFSLVSNLVCGFLATREKNSQYSISDKVI